MHLANQIYRSRICEAMGQRPQATIILSCRLGAQNPLPISLSESCCTPALHMHMDSSFFAFCSCGDWWLVLSACFLACQPSPMVPCSCFCPHHMLCLPRHGFWLPGSSPFQSASATSFCNCNSSISYLPQQKNIQ